MKKVVLIVVFFLLGVLLLGCIDEDFYPPPTYISEEPQNTPEPLQDVKSTPTPEILTLTANKFYLEYKKNEIAADRKYKGKVIRISGTINNIGKDIFDAPYITLKTLGTLENIYCEFNKEKEGQLMDLKKEDSVIVECICKGKALYSIMMEDCNLISKNSPEPIKTLTSSSLPRSTPKTSAVVEEPVPSFNHVFCKDVSNEHPYCVGESNEFYQENEKIWSVITFERTLNREISIEWKLFDPDENLIYENSILTKPEWSIVWNSWSMHPDIASKYGKWRLDIYIDGEKKYEDYFTIRLHEIGDTVKSSKVQVTIFDVEITKSYEYWSDIFKKAITKDAPYGYWYIIVDAEVKNIGADSIYVGDYDFSVADSEGYRYDSAFYYGKDDFDSFQELYLGQKIRGKILFEVPITSEGWILQYDFGDILSGTKIVSWKLVD